MIRRTNAIWRGTGRDGSGNLSTESQVLARTPFSFRSRFESEKGQTIQRRWHGHRPNRTHREVTDGERGQILSSKDIALYHWAIPRASVRGFNATLVDRRAVDQ